MRLRTTSLFFGLGGAMIACGLTACGGDNSEIILTTDGGGTTTIIEVIEGGTTIIQTADGGTTTISNGKLLIASTSTAANATCANGGTTISVGYDTNGNGTLDPSEVTSSQEVCNAADAGVPTQILTTIASTSADDMCANGGTVFSSGADTNGNGVLDPSEITTTQEICGSTPGGLSVTTALPVGSQSCPLGGSETKSGSDNGAGGGTANDGILEPGEVTSTVDTCNTTATTPPNASGYYNQPFAPPAAVANQPAGIKITATGGTGSAGAGGNGSQFVMDNLGTLGGHVKLFSTGLAATAFTAPAYTPNYGATECDLATTGTILVETAATAAMNDCFISSVDGNLYVETAAGVQTRATGLHIAAMATLTVPAAYTTLNVSNDIYVEGTLATATNATTGNATALTLVTSGTFASSAGGAVSAAGASVAGATGGNGGGLTINASTVNAQGALSTAGATATGTGSHAGGQGANISINLPAPPVGTFTNTGAITASGGAGIGGGSGGNAGSITLTSYSGLSNSGAITAVGGAGSGAGTAGAGGFVSLYAANQLPLLNSGAINTSGGSADAACTTTNCTGGNAGYIVLVASKRSDLKSSGALSAVGGNSPTSNPGNGNTINLTVQRTTSNDYYGNGPSYGWGSIEVSGALSSSGGNGRIGGSAGGISAQFSSNAYYYYLDEGLRGQEVRFLGYANLDVSGGAGTTGGGNSGAVYLTTHYSQYNQANNSSPQRNGTGSVLINVATTANGGAATTSGNGGNGGYIQYSVQTNGNDDNGAMLVESNGAVSVNGGAGAGAGNGGAAGYFNAHSFDGTFIGASVTGIGGASSSTGTAGSANSGPSFDSSFGPLQVTAAIDFAGGAAAGTGAGGSCGALYLQTSNNLLTTSGALTCAGGASVGGTGGNGGTLRLADGTGLTTTGSYNVTGGTGVTAGTKGSVYVNNVLQ